MSQIGLDIEKEKKKNDELDERGVSAGSISFGDSGTTRWVESLVVR